MISTNWDWHKIVTILQMTFLDLFCMKIVVFLFQFHKKLVLKGLINNIPALVQIMAKHQTVDKSLSEPMMA